MGKPNSKLATDMTDGAVRLRSLAPQLEIITPKQFAEQLKPRP